MTKKRRLSASSPVKVEIKEENVGNDYLMAKGRLKGVLKQLTEKSSEESESSDEEQARRQRRYQPRRARTVTIQGRSQVYYCSDPNVTGIVKYYQYKKPNKNVKECLVEWNKIQKNGCIIKDCRDLIMINHLINDKKRNQIIPAPYHHTYVMKLYDRSVDLARFEEETPLYPLCRAWMENQPKNPQKIIKRRTSSPEPDNVIWDDSAVDVRRLPPPSKPFETRIPSPLPEQLEQNKDNINLNYDECPPVDKNTLIRNHLQRWVKVKKKWIEAASNNEERYSSSFGILQTIYNKAQDHME